MSDFREKGPVLDYLLKEVSLSTCDNSFFGELEKEMLVPNNINIYGKITGATSSLNDYELRLEFPGETAIAYIKQPSSNTIEADRRVLTYPLSELINFDDYWWLPLHGETEFSLTLNLLPPFPRLNPLDIEISCRPDVAVGLEANVTTTVRLQAEERIDSLYVRHAIPRFVNPGMSIAISHYSGGDDAIGPGQTLTIPKERFPYEPLRLATGQTAEYKIDTKIIASPKNMTFLKCQQSILTSKVVALTDSTPRDPPCSISIRDSNGLEMPVKRTLRSTILQASAEIMYSPFSVQRDNKPANPQVIVQAVA